MRQITRPTGRTRTRSRIRTSSMLANSQHHSALFHLTAGWALPLFHPTFNCNLRTSYWQCPTLFLKSPNTTTHPLKLYLAVSQLPVVRFEHMWGHFLIVINHRNSSLVSLVSFIPSWHVNFFCIYRILGIKIWVQLVQQNAAMCTRTHSPSPPFLYPLLLCFGPCHNCNFD